jgi:hypothetical protein
MHRRRKAFGGVPEVIDSAEEPWICVAGVRSWFTSKGDRKSNFTLYFSDGQEVDRLMPDLIVDLGPADSVKFRKCYRLVSKTHLKPLLQQLMDLSDEVNHSHICVFFCLVFETR